MDTGRLKFILSAVGAVLAISVVALLIIFIIRQESTPICELDSKQPHYDNQTKLENFISQDATSIANFQGFLEYQFDSKSEDDEHKYLDLKLQSILTDGQDMLVLNADCCKLSIAFGPPIDSDQTRPVKSIKLDLKRPNGESDSCVIVNLCMSTSQTHHYRCREVQKLLCYDPDAPGEYDELVPVLVINRIEFELFGDPKLIRNKNFSTEPRECCV